MTDSLLRQRIAYLVTHGGLYPESRPRWLPWVIALVVLQVITIAVILLE